MNSFEDNIKDLKKWINIDIRSPKTRNILIKKVDFHIDNPDLFSPTLYLKLSNIAPGSSILLRQLNNHKDWSLFFGEGFIEDKAFDKYWQGKDRSLFYDHFRLFVKV